VHGQRQSKVYLRRETRLGLAAPNVFRDCSAGAADPPPHVGGYGEAGRENSVVPAAYPTSLGFVAANRATLPAAAAAGRRVSMGIRSYSNLKIPVRALIVPLSGSSGPGAAGKEIRIMIKIRIRSGRDKHAKTR